MSLATMMDLDFDFIVFFSRNKTAFVTSLSTPENSPIDQSSDIDPYLIERTNVHWMKLVSNESRMAIILYRRVLIEECWPNGFLPWAWALATDNFYGQIAAN